MQANNQMEVLSMKANKRTMAGFLALFLTIASQGSAYAQKKAAEFDPALWDLERAKIVDHLGRKALIGSTFLKDIRLQNGVIEVDIATTERSRSYPGLLFRVQDSANYERVYIRPHRSPFYDDVLQYGPVFNGVDSWQLYNGPGLTAGLEVLPDRWNHIKILMAGKQAQIFWNDLPEAVLVIDDLAHGDGSGTIGLVGPMDGTAFFSNLNYEKDDSLTLPPPAPREAMPGLISVWEISAPFAAIGVDFTKYPAEAFAAASWNPVAADRRGLVDVSRIFPRKFRAGDCLLARTTLAAESDSLLRVNFGYSDIITVFLNGRPLYSGNAIYQSRDRSFLGIVGYYDDLFLPLMKGDNELLLLLGETMGGWGFCFRSGDEVFTHAALKKEWSTKNGLALPEAVVLTLRTTCATSPIISMRAGNSFPSFPPRRDHRVGMDQGAAHAYRHATHGKHPLRGGPHRDQCHRYQKAGDHKKNPVARPAHGQRRGHGPGRKPLHLGYSGRHRVPICRRQAGALAGEPEPAQRPAVRKRPAAGRPEREAHRREPQGQGNAGPGPL